MTLSIQTLDELLQDLLPSGDTRFELRLSPGARSVLQESGDVHVSAQLIVFEPDGTRLPMDVKEQELCLLSDQQMRIPEARLVAYLRAWARALPSLVDAYVGPREAWDVRTLMPHDLLFPEALDDDQVSDIDGFSRLFASDEVIARWLSQRTKDYVTETIEHLGLGAFASELIALRRPAIRLLVDEPHDEDEEDLPIGASRIGGLPDLPRGVPWPRLGGAPLSFVAQIRLADLAGFPGAESLPPTGLLSFFYDATGESNHDENGKWAWPPRHRGGTRVMHFEEDPSTFVRVAAPEDKPVPVFPSYEVDYRREQIMPSMESPFYEALDEGAAHDNEWYERFSQATLLNETDDDPDDPSPVHRLLGYTDLLQGDPYLEAHLYALGQNFDGWQQDGPRERALKREATRWRLLLQIDAGPENDLLNQDGGYFYFLIPQESLLARRFDDVWGISQGH